MPDMNIIRETVMALCAPACAGRKPGTAQGRAARAVIVEALRGAGLDPFEQAVPGCDGANVLATIPGEDPRYVVVGAHYDHLGIDGKDVYWGADDNAAAVGVLMAVASSLAGDRKGRGVIIAAFDGEEPPFAGTAGMGSEAFVQNPSVPLSSIDFMICMDLVGHRVGAEHLPDSIGHSLFALGAEKSTGTRALVEGMAQAQPGLVVRPVDAEIIRPLSDYAAFWREQVPFLFLSAGRSAVYHTPLDTPEKLDFEKIDATAHWLTQLTRAARVRDDAHRFEPSARDDRGTLTQVTQLFAAAAESSSRAEQALRQAQLLIARCDQRGRLTDELRPALLALTAGLEAGFA